jgi:tetratricopeptide (TPR) repeat protein
MHFFFSFEKFRFKFLGVFFVLSGFTCSNGAYSQDIEVMVIAENDSTSLRLKALNYYDKSNELKDQGNFKEAQKAALKGIHYVYLYNDLVKDSTSNSLLLFQTKLFRAYAVNSYYVGEYVESMHFYDKALVNLGILEADSSLHNSIYQIKARCLNGKATVLSTQGIISHALDNFLKALKLYESEKDSAGIAKMNNNIGIVYKKQGIYKEAEEYYLKALGIYLRLKNQSKQILLYNNLGLLFVDRGFPDKALLYLEKAKELNDKLHISRSIAHTYQNMGDAYFLKKEYELAIENYNNAILIQKEKKDGKGLVNAYIALAKVYKEFGNYAKARLYLAKCQAVNDKLNILSIKVDVYKMHYEMCMDEKQISKALRYHILYKNSSDSLFILEQRAEVAKIQLNYDLNQKMQEFELLKKEKEHNKEQLNQRIIIERRQVIIIIISTSLLILALVFVWFMLKRLKINRLQRLTIQNQKMEMDDKNRILKNAYEEINQQKHEITKQRNALSNQKDKAFSLFNDLKSSILYAEHIQKALLPDVEQMDEIFTDYFVLNRPHSIVSGDFYWGRVVNDWKIFAVADCTGHGVPGALMSMLGITFLNEIVKYKDVSNTALVLGYLRKYIINSLKSSHRNSNSRDGMDIAAFAKEPNSKNLHFAGANGSIYIIRETEIPMIVDKDVILPTMTYEMKNLYEIKGDRMPIGFDEEMSRFSNTLIEIEDDDQIYLFSDGYADQFGGDRGKKMKYQRFKKIILESSKANLIEQKVVLAEFLDNWMGDLKQVDDILIVGGRIRI